jgi:hypothetical protein
VANIDYLERKNISKKLIFTRAINQIKRDKCFINGKDVLNEMMPRDIEEPWVYIENRETSWKLYVEDICAAKSKIHIDIPDVIADKDKPLKEIINALAEKREEGLDICIRRPEEIDLPEGLQEYTKIFKYVTNPVTIIDKKIIWFGQPLYAADFVSEGEMLDTEYFPCIRFNGYHAARSLQAFLEI